MKTIPIVNIERKEYERYCYNEHFLQNQVKRYLSWGAQYCMNGEVALDQFVVSDTQTWKLVLYKCVVDDGYCVGVGVRGRDDDPNIYTLMVGITVLDDKMFDFYIDIPEDDEAWTSHGIHTMDDMNEALKEYSIHCARVGVTLFAKIQNDAFKSRSKIIRMQNYATKNEVIKGDTLDESQYKTIQLSPGVKIYVVNESGVPRTIIRHCEAWEVRGHYRHYKNGKTVYIAPYQKGKGRLKHTNYSIKEKTL